MQRRFDKVLISKAILIYLFLGCINRVSPPMRISYDTLFHVYIVSLHHRCCVAQTGRGRPRHARAITPPARAITFRPGIGIVVIRRRAGRVPTERSLITSRAALWRSSRFRNAFGGKTRSSSGSTRTWTRCRATLRHHSVVHRRRPSSTFAHKAALILDLNSAPARRCTRPVSHGKSL